MIVNALFEKARAIKVLTALIKKPEEMQKQIKSIEMKINVDSPIYLTHKNIYEKLLIGIEASTQLSLNTGWGPETDEEINTNRKYVVILGKVLDAFVDQVDSIKNI